MPLENLITLIAAAIAIVVGPIIAWRTANAALKRTAKQDVVDSLQTEVDRLNVTITTMDATETKHRAQISELFTLGLGRQGEIDVLRAENMALTHRVADNLVQCTADTAALRQEHTTETLGLKVRIAELEAQLKVSPVFNGTAPLAVRLAGVEPDVTLPITAAVDLPVVVKGPLPLPTAAQVAAQAAVAAADEAAAAETEGG